MGQIETTIDTKLLVCADENLGEILAEFLDVIQQESRINVNHLKISFEMSKSYYIDRNNIKA